MGPNPYGPSRRTDFRVIVTGLPLSCSWQDLKDHMRRAGDVTFSQVRSEGLLGAGDPITTAKLLLCAAQTHGKASASHAVIPGAWECRR